MNKNEVYRANGYMEKLDMEPSLDRRRKAEHMLYIQELRREDMSIRHFLLEKNWARAWMMFRTRKLLAEVFEREKSNHTGSS